jgi:leucyl aminopeptidase
MKATALISAAIALCLATLPHLVSSKPAKQTSFQAPTALSARLQPDTLRLLATDDYTAVWANPEEFIQSGKSFIDITDHIDLDHRAAFTRERHQHLTLPTKPSHSTTVNPMLNRIDTERMRERLTKLTSYMNRYYRSKTGQESAKWVQNTVQQILDEHKITWASIQTFRHSWPQNSLIVRILPVEPVTEQTPIVIVGAHQDTVRGGFFEDGRAPGADDDGSGSTTTLEAFSVLMASKYRPQKDILEFHWYSAEEVGLRGSQDIAAAYQRDNHIVKAMIQFDMTGYYKNQEHIGIVTDYTDPELTKFLKEIVKSYSRLEAKDTKCKYGCSDHASWNKAGFRSAFPFEGLFEEASPFIHGKEDTVENVDFGHMKEFCKIAIAFAIELTSS